MQWNAIVSESYPGFRPPRTAPPAIKDKNTPLQSVVPVVEQPASPAVEETVEAEEVVTEIPAAGEAAEDPAAVETVNDGLVLEPAAEDAEGTAAVPAADKGAAPAKTPAAPAVKYTEYVVKPGDSLSVIAKKFYKDGRLFDRIYEANKDVIKNPNRLPLGLKIRIPQL